MTIVTTTNKYCFACGKTVEHWIHKQIINDRLADDWKLNSALRKLFDVRESSFCPYCDNSLRTRSLAKAIVGSIPLGARNLIDWVQKANKSGLRVAEINGCGKLHEILAELKNLSYSEYTSENDLKIRIKNFLKDIRREDLLDLSYSSERFDLVINSDVLEHVPDYKTAMAECKRVLKSGGMFLFTVPIIWNRKTIGRSKMRPSFHGSGESDNLVYWEFGDDVVSQNNLEIVSGSKTKGDYVLGLKKSR